MTTTTYPTVADAVAATLEQVDGRLARRPTPDRVAPMSCARLGLEPLVHVGMVASFRARTCTLAGAHQESERQRQVAASYMGNADDRLRVWGARCEVPPCR